MTVVADSHAIYWYIEGSARLSEAAGAALRTAEEADGVVVSVASLLDLWYVTKTTGRITADELTRLLETIEQADGLRLHPVDAAVYRTFGSFGLDVLRDPWDRAIVATALALGVPLVTRDRAIRAAGIVETVW